MLLKSETLCIVSNKKAQALMEVALPHLALKRVHFVLWYLTHFGVSGVRRRDEE